MLVLIGKFKTSKDAKMKEDHFQNQKWTAGFCSFNQNELEII